MFLPACTNKKKAKAAPAPVAVATSSPAPVPSPTPTPTPTPSATSSMAPTPSPSPSPSKAAVKAKPRAKVAVGHPLTGGTDKIGPVVVVKIDNDPTGFSQSGLAAADVIYEELIENGETRLAAIYSTKRPGLVGPIRSARETDIELLGQYGKVSLAFSGANRLILGVVRRANLVDARWDAVPSAYTELRSKRSPHRVHASVAAIMDRKTGANAKDIGLRFGYSRSPSGPAKKVSISWGGSSNTVRYNPSTQRWTVFYGNHQQVTVDNLIVQYVKIKMTGFTDAAGSRTPLARTLGSGKLTVFREGRAIDGTWHRQHMKDRTVMLDTKRRLQLLRRGTTFIMLVPNNRPVSITR